MAKHCSFNFWSNCNQISFPSARASFKLPDFDWRARPVDRFVIVIWLEYGNSTHSLFSPAAPFLFANFFTLLHMPQQETDNNSNNTTYNTNLYNIGFLIQSHSRTGCPPLPEATWNTEKSIDVRMLLFFWLYLKRNRLSTKLINDNSAAAWQYEYLCICKQIGECEHVLGMSWECPAEACNWERLTNF